ncbi:MAG: SpoIIE family protein phosphatase [Clostridia bacterium]|nr:SpoIIE family protein phosphatase [Clostridia bacterium]
MRIVVSVWIADNGRTPAQKKSRGSKESGRIKNFFREMRESPGNTIASALSVSAGGTMLRENIRVRLALAACTALFAGAWSAAEGGYEYVDLFGAVFSLLLTPVVTYLFYAVGERKMRYSPIREIAVYFCAAVVTLALTTLSHGGITGLDASVLGISRKHVFDWGVLFAFAAAVITSTEYGVHRGALLGLACGLVMQPVYAPSYAIAALVAGSFAGFSTVFAVLAAGALASAWAVYVAGLTGMTDLFAPIFTACAALIPVFRFHVLRLPDSLFGTELYGQRTRRKNTDAAMAEVTASNLKNRIHALSDGMQSLSDVLGGMAQRLTKPVRADYEEITRTAFDTYCHTCRSRERCHEAKKSKTEPVIRQMTEQLVREGAVHADIVPSSMAASCWNMGRILDEINLAVGKKIAEGKRGDKLSVSAADYGLAGELMRQAAKAEAAEAEPDERLSAKLRRVLSYHNFGAASVTVYGERQKHIFVSDVDLTATRMGGEDIRKLFESLVGLPLSAPEFSLDGAVLSMKMRSVPRFGCTAGMYSCAASQVQKYWQKVRNCGADSQADPDADEIAETESCEAEESAGAEISITDEEPDGVCGDGIVSFETGGKQYMILSDGMGSGREAAVTSSVVISLLERLIRAGADMESALKMLNGIVRCTGRECSATVDIAQIDLVTGEARFVKSGAAPSFILRDGSIFRLQSKTVPIGIIRALDAEMITFTVEEGDTVVMVSDGAARSYDEAPWLLDLMTDDHTVLFGDERSAAVTIVSEAALRGSTDDITAGIMRIRAGRKESA